MNNSAITKSRLRGYFEKYAKPIGVVAVVQHFSDVKVANLNYHLKGLVDEGFLVKPKRGLYQKNPAYQSPQEKRKLVDTHIATNGSPVKQGEAWKPGTAPLTESVNPAMIAYLGRLFGESIVARMKERDFTTADVRFVEGLLQRIYTVSEQQMAQCERAWAAAPTVPSSVSSNGRSGSGSS